MSLLEVCRKEIETLHRSFDDWFNGRVPSTLDNFSLIESVLGESFVIVMPEGNKLERTPLLQSLYEAHSSRTDIRIWIKNVRIVSEDEALVVAEYEEWQEDGGQMTSRYSTVVFRRNGTMPNGLEWLRVHETWFGGDSI